VRDDDDRDVAAELVDELLDLLGAEGIERRRRLVEQDDAGSVAITRAMRKSLLTTGKRRG
jgi:hypothetical protein